MLHTPHTVCKKNDEQGKDKKERRTLMRSPTLDGRADIVSGGGGAGRGESILPNQICPRRERNARDGTVT